MYGAHEEYSEVLKLQGGLSREKAAGTGTARGIMDTKRRDSACSDNFAKREHPSRHQ